MSHLLPAGKSFPMPYNLLSALTEDFPNISLRLVDSAVYRSFRNLEPGLVSVLDKMSLKEMDRLEVLAFLYKDEPVGIVSLITALNEHRKVARNFYARVDLVIVRPEYRKLGIAAAIVLSTLAFALEARGKELYSVSCLAAHPAIENILRKFGFLEKRKEDMFVLLEKSIEDAEVQSLQENLYERAAEACHLANYKIRQQEIA